MLLNEVLLAAANIGDQAQRQRQIVASREEGNGLLLAVVGNLDVVFCEVGDELSLGVADRECDINQSDVYPDSVQLLGEAEGQDTEKCDCGAHADYHRSTYAARSPRGRKIN